MIDKYPGLEGKERRRAIERASRLKRSTEVKEQQRKYYLNGGKEKVKQWAANNRESTNASNRRYHDRNKEVINQKHRDRYQLNRPTELERRRKYREENRLACNDRVYDWISRNPGTKRSYTAKRRALRLKATPIWSEPEKIRTIYIDCPDGSEVDHIVPLQGKLVCGLHVHNNLQYLTPEANRIKSNKWP